MHQRKLNDKKNAPKFLVLGPSAQKNRFGYWFAHHGYLLMSCPGQD